MHDIGTYRLIGLTLVALVPFCAHGQKQWDSSAPSAEPMPGFASVDIGGRSLRYKCQGSGAPTVIIEPGGSVSVETVTSWNLPRGWPVIIREVAKTTRVCAYDRAGLGRSDKATLPRTSLDVAKDLHVLLDKADIEPPYVIAGQSYGGMLSASPTWNDPYAPDDVEPLIKAVGQRLNADLAALSTNSKHIVASKAGHNIQADEPQLVTDAILDVVAQVRAKAK